MIIRNRDVLSTTKARKQVLDIIEAGIDKVLPTSIMKSVVKYDSANRIINICGHEYYKSSGRVFVIGGGKASGLMAEALEGIIPPEDIAAGVINCKSENYKTQKIKVITAGHPIPDQRGVNGVREMLALKQRYAINETDIVICLISGGSSALMPNPANGISLMDKQIVTELLINSGAEIGEINVVRKHLSQTKGGQLGQFYSPATVISLILSDVIGNDLATIASGPTYPDPSTFSDAYQIIERYRLLGKTPKKVIYFLQKGLLGEIAETPKTVNNCDNYIIGDNKLALDAMQRRSKEMGLAPFIITSQQKGDTNAVALSRAEEILNSKYPGYDTILIGGETTLRLPAITGRGGRNQHYAAASMLVMEKYTGEWVVASIGTDGSDFLPDVAGAIVDRGSLNNAKANGLDIGYYLKRFDSNTLLDQIGNSLIMTGDTGTNVGDIIIYLLS
jgi:glycerate 2-kinase